MVTNKEREFWDKAVVMAMAKLIPFGVSGDVDDFGPKEVANDAAQYADAMLAERRERVKQ